MAASTTQTALGLSSSHNSLDSLSGTEASSSDASPRRAYHKDTSRVSKETILSQSSKGWAGPGSGSGLGTPSPTSPLRLGKQPPSLSVDENSAPAISAKQHQPRRTSNSFRQLQRGLVSSSPFKSPEFSPSRFSNSTTARSVPLPRVSRLNQNNTARKDINIGLGIEDGPRSPEIPTSPLFSDDGDSPELKSAAYFAPKRVTPRKTQTFSQLQSHKLVSGSPFISSPSSPAESPGFTGSESSPEEQPAETQQATHNSALSKPRRMLGPRSLPNLNAQNTPQEAEAKQHSPALEEMGRPRSKTVTWGDDEVKEFVKEDFEDEDPSRRSSCTSSSSTDSPDLDGVLSAEEMMQRLIQEDAEETARWQADNPDLAQQNSSNLPDYCHSARSSPAESEHNGDSSSEYEMSPVLPLRSPTRESQPVFPSVHESTASNQDVAPLRSSFELPDCPTSSPMPNFSDFAKSPVPPPQSSFDDVQPAQEPQPLEEKEGEMLEPPTTSTPLQAEDPPLPVENSPEPSNIGFNSQAQDPSPAASPQPKPASRRPPKLTREAIQERMRRKHLGLDPSASPEPSTPPPPDAQTEQAHHVEETHRDVQSPLEKLGADLNPALPVDTDGMPSSGSESSLAFRAPPSPTPSKQDHESGILAARRRAKERKGERPVKHRRSMSTGDADLSSSRNSRTDEEPDTAIRLQSSRTPEEDDMRDFKPMAATPAAELPSFGHSASFGRQLHLQMQQAYENSDKSYRTVEHRVVASDSVQTVGQAGDVAKPRGWKRINRPSDMNTYAAELRELRSNTSSRKPAGIVFLALRRVHWSVPMPRHPVRLYRLLSNSDSTVRSDTTAPMRSEMELDDQWELLRRQALTCTVAFQADMSTYQRTAASEVSPSFSSKSSGGFRSRLFGSPKKQRPVSTPVMPVDPFLSYVSPEGMLAKAVIDFEQCRPHCIGRRSKFSFPLVSPSNGMQIGTLDTHMFYLPPLSPLSSQLWPKSMHECEDGVRLLQKFGTEQRVLLKGELSQIGADCKFWRRRLMVAKGHQLIAFNEVTKRPHTCFDLTQATAVEDCAAIQSHTPPTFSGRSSAHRHTLSDPEEEPYTDVPHSLRVTLQPLADAEPEVVYFYADDEPTKHRWLQVLGSIVNAHNSASSSQPPLWAVYMQELLASQGKVRSASSQHLDAAALVAK